MTEYILSESSRYAHATASIDWRWERIGRNTYRTPSGARAEVINSVNSLRGIQGAIVYLAYGWWFLPGRDKEMLQALVSMGRVTYGESEKGAAQ